MGTYHANIITIETGSTLDALKVYMIGPMR